VTRGWQGPTNIAVLRTHSNCSCGKGEELPGGRIRVYNIFHPYTCWWNLFKPQVRARSMNRKKYLAKDKVTYRIKVTYVQLGRCTTDASVCTSTSRNTGIRRLSVGRTILCSLQRMHPIQTAEVANQRMHLEAIRDVTCQPWIENSWLLCLKLVLKNSSLVSALRILRIRTTL